MLKKIVLSILLIAGIHESNAMEKIPSEKPSNLKIVDVDGHRIYTAEIKLKSGEIAYFAMEPIINEDRSNKWRAYGNVTSTLTQMRSYLYATFIRPELFEKITSIFPNTHVHEAEVRNLITNFIKTGPNEKMANAMYGIEGGIRGMHSSIGTYITYISKEPVTGFFPFPEQAPEEKDFDAYIDAYDNLIMSVSSYHTLDKGAEDEYQHRGIFRNPISMLRKDYQGLGILIHAFTGLAWSIEFPEKKYMTVNPDGNEYMRFLLENNFTEAEKGYAEEDAIGRSKKKSGGDVIVKIDALKSKFPLFQ